jgi:hypothetical protein
LIINLSITIQQTNTVVEIPMMDDAISDAANDAINDVVEIYYTYRKLQYLAKYHIKV